jgi:hypothetical protein
MTDTAFLCVEFRGTPMHVGGISLFEFPEVADEQKFIRRFRGPYAIAISSR